MLLVWIFALASSIVNACLADHGPWQVVPTSSHHAGLAHQSAPCHAHVANDDASGHEPGLPPAGSGACAKFCVDKSNSTPVYKQQSDPLATVWLAPPPTASVDTHATLQQLGAFHAEHPPSGARIPIPIAYLRLTL